MSKTRITWNYYRELVAAGMDRESARRVARAVAIKRDALLRGGQI